MEFSTSLVLAPKHFAIYGVMKEFVVLESKRQHTFLSLITKYTFNKLGDFTQGIYLGFKSPLKDFSTLGENFSHSKWLGVILHQVTMKVTIEALDLQEVPLHLFPRGLLGLWLVLIFDIGLVPLSLVLRAFVVIT
jgi:hypothetical protein